MSTLKTDAITAATGTNTDLDLSGKGSGVPDIATGFKVGGTAGLPINNLRTGTDGELITWDASGDPATVAVGTATHVLTSNGAGAAPTFQAAAGGGAWNLIGSATASDTATLTITGIDTTYRTYCLRMTGMQPASDNKDANLRVGDSGGIKSDSLYYWNTGKQTSNTYAYDGAAGNPTTALQLTSYVGNATGEIGGGTVFIGRTGDTVSFDGNMALGHTSGGSVGGWVSGIYKVASFVMTQVQFYYSSGNVSVGTIDLWGLSHA